MSKLAIRFTSTVVVALLALTVLVARDRYAERRVNQLEQATFVAGTPESAVIRVLGKPDQELSGADVRKQPSGFDPECVARAHRKISYSPPANGGPYVSIYLDSAGRVLCVEHGLRY